jgi:Flp pilus assembly protein TadG
MTRPQRSDSGAIAPFVVVVAVAMITLVGAVLDGGRVLRAQADVFGIAAAAARTGAAQIDQNAVLQGEFRLDSTAAEEAAYDYLAARDLAGTVEIDGLEVTVTAHQDIDFRLLPGSANVEETATARATQERAP